MKKFFTIALIALFCVSLAPAAYAATPGEWFQSQIASILSQIEQLQLQLNEMMGGEGKRNTAAVVDNSASTNKKTLVLIFKSKDYPGPVVPVDSIKAYYGRLAVAARAAFLGKIPVAFDVYGWETLNRNINTSNELTNDDIVAVVNKYKIDLSQYSSVITEMGTMRVCTVAEFCANGAPKGFATEIAGTTYILNRFWGGGSSLHSELLNGGRETEYGGMIHEMGHLLMADKNDTMSGLGHYSLVSNLSDGNIPTISQSTGGGGTVSSIGSVMANIAGCAGDCLGVSFEDAVGLLKRLSYDQYVAKNKVVPTDDFYVVFASGVADGVLEIRGLKIANTTNKGLRGAVIDYGAGKLYIQHTSGLNSTPPTPGGLLISELYYGGWGIGASVFGSKVSCLENTLNCVYTTQLWRPNMTFSSPFAGVVVKNIKINSNGTADFDVQIKNQGSRMGVAASTYGKKTGQGANYYGGVVKIYDWVKPKSFTPEKYIIYRTDNTFSENTGRRFRATPATVKGLPACTNGTVDANCIVGQSSTIPNSLSAIIDSTAGDGREYLYGVIAVKGSEYSTPSDLVLVRNVERLNSSISPVSFSSDTMRASVTVKNVPCKTVFDWTIAGGSGSTSAFNCSAGNGIVVEQTLIQPINRNTAFGKYPAKVVSRDGLLSMTGDISVLPYSVLDIKVGQFGGVAKFSWAANNPGGTYQFVLDDGQWFEDFGGIDGVAGALGGLSVYSYGSCEQKDGLVSEWAGCMVQIDSGKAITFSSLPTTGKITAYVRAIGSKKDVASNWYRVDFDGCVGPKIRSDFVVVRSPDLNSDGLVNQVDVDALNKHLNTTKVSGSACVADINMDNKIDGVDAGFVTRWITKTQYSPDVNRDGFVNRYTVGSGDVADTDYGVLFGINMRGGACPVGVVCDLNGDKSVNSTDLLRLDNFIGGR